MSKSRPKPKPAKSDLAQPAPTQPPPPQFLPPLPPQRRLLIILSILTALWIVALVLLYALTT